LYRIISEEDTGRLYINYVSDNWEMVTGLKPHQVADDMAAFFSAVHPDDVDNIHQETIKSKERLDHFIVEIRIKIKGEYRWLKINAKPYWLDNKVIWDGIMTDITDRKEIEQALEVEHKRLESLSNNLPNSTIYRLISEEDTGKFYMQYVSDRWEAITGLAPQDVADDMTPFFAAVHPDDVDYIKKASDASKDCTDYFVVEIRIKIKGEYRWLNISSKPYKLDEKIIWDGIMTDITQRKETERALDEHREELQDLVEELKANNEEIQAMNEELAVINEELFNAKEKAIETERLKSEFLANFSHEVRTPLSGIIGLLGELQKDEKIPEEARRIISIIGNSSEHLLTLMNDILDDAKIEAGQLTMQPEPVDINRMLLETQIFFEKFMQKSNKENIHIEISMDEKLGESMVLVDPVRLKQVLYNLMSNAVKFTHKGFIQIGYRLTDKDMIEFWVEDTGIGIPAEQLSSMFERFQQAVRSDRKHYSGTGLGLSISKTLSKLMGGDLYAKSTEGEGSTFYLTIPHIPA